MKTDSITPVIGMSRINSAPLAGSGLLGCDVEKREADRLAKEEAERERREEADFWEQLERLAAHSI